MILKKDLELCRDDMDLINQSLEVLADSLRRGLEYEDLFERASNDPLTGLANRRVFDDRINGMIDSARRYCRPLTMILMDLDKFKNINDHLGHQAGDDVLVSVANVLSPDMIKTMADRPIVFALANPNPEIEYELATKTREDLIMATGRSDHPNQVNNVLGFPFIFRGAMDVRATGINEEMKIAAVKALAELAKKDVPDMVNMAYKEMNLNYGVDYIIPKPLDPRLLTVVAPAVAKAAIESGIAREPITDWEAYEMELEERMGRDNKLIRALTDKAKRNPKRVVFAEGENFKVLKAAQTVLQEGIAQPILLGDKDEIKQIIRENELDLEDVPIINWRSPEEIKRRENYAKILFEKRIKGWTRVKKIALIKM